METTAATAKTIGVAPCTGEETACPAASEQRKRNIRDFIENKAPDQKRLWMICICAGFCIVVACTILLAFALGAPGGAAGPPEQAVNDPANAPHPAEEAPLNEKAQVAPIGKVQQLARTFTGAEAEASVGPLKYASRLAPAARQTEETDASGDAAVAGQVKQLLSQVESACEQEDRETLVAMLDGQEGGMPADYLRNADRLFRSFDDISVSFSAIQVYPVSEGEVLVSAHVRVEGAFAITGAWKILSNSSRSFTLRKRANSDWKLCSVNM